MDNYVTITEYRIEDYVFICEYKPTPDKSPVGVYLRNIKHKKEYYKLSIEEDAMTGVSCFKIDLLDPDFACGGWYPVFTFEDGTEKYCGYKDMISRLDYSVMLDLGLTTLAFDPINKVHFMGAIDADSRFLVRKWRNKLEYIKKSSILVNSFEADGLNIHLEITSLHHSKIEQVELWIWNKAARVVERIPLDADMVNSGFIDINLNDYVNNYDVELYDKLSEMYLMYNINGTYFQSTLEIRKPEQARKKIYISSDIDEEFRYVLSYPIMNDAGTDYEWVFQLYFNYHAELCAKVVPRRYMYTNMYRGKIIDFKLKDGILKIRLFYMKNEFENYRLVLRYCPEDPSGKQDEYIFNVEDVKERKKGKVITYSLDYSKVNWTPLRYELLVLCDKDNYCYELKAMGKDRKFYRNLSKVYKNSYLTKDDMYVFISENIGQKLVFDCRKRNEYDDFKYRLNEGIATFLYYPFRLIHRKHYLLFYEKFCTAAQDNSYYMFQYFMEHPNRKVMPIYVIEEKQPEYKELKKKYGKNVVAFMSKRHLLYLQAASMFVSTDSKRHCYRWRSGTTRILRSISDKRFVFLQHGVLGYKRVDNIYGKQYVNRADLFVASSEFEKTIINRWFGYDDKEIIVTGLARWDKLVSEPSNPPMIFYMPTWRNWIFEVDDEEAFVNTDYYKEYYRIINSKELIDMLHETDTRLVFCMHPKFRQFYNCLKSTDPYITIFDYESCKINEMLMKCNMFVTDYSSASWDVFYMDKPVLFYQFDADKYAELQGSYISLDKVLFGRRVTEFDSFIEEIRSCIKSGFECDERDARMKEEYLAVRDATHRQRIYDEIMKRL